MAGRALAALLLLTAFQLRPPAQSATPGRTGSIAEAYGEPRDAELASIAYNTESLRREHVRTRGRLELIGTSHYFALADGGNRVLVLLGNGLDDSDVRSLLGSRVVARGIVRPIRKKEYMHGMDADLIEDPLLPVLPAPDVSLPPVSLTLLSVSDDEQPGRVSSRAASGAIAQILATPTAVAGKSITVVGQFRGRNLFEDLPKNSQQSPDDWVLRDGASAAWIVGKPPRGRGFSLDIDSKNDSARRVEVTGKATVVNDIVYIKASDVRIAVRNAKAPER